MTATPKKIQLTLRPAEERDVPAIQQIAREAWDETFGGNVGRLERQEILDHLCSRRSLLEDIGRHESFFFVAALEDGVVGFAEVVAEGRAGEVARIAVLPDWQRRGIATSLLCRGLAALAAAGAQKVTAAVEVQDVACRQLLERNGFRVVDEPQAELEELEEAMELVQLRRTLDDAAGLEAAAEATVWVEDGRRPYPRTRPRFVTVLSTSDESRLSFVEAALEGAGIVYAVHRTNGGGRPEGPAEVQVAESRADEAREVLDALEEVELADQD
ncbi:MAG TPA: GNAT family N-acetyltransferase [Thermoanaerobaculia bacterium]|nr:GNAT family N-acetyltransferase [Thermoanaerobaculia bacterium]